MTIEKEKARRKAERARYKYLKEIGKEFDRQNPDACPDCKGRPGFQDYADEGGGEHAPWCKVARSGT